MARPTARYRVTAEDATKQGLDSVRRNLGSLKTSFAAAAAAGGAVFAVFSKSAFSAADELNKVNDRLNISTEALSQYRFVAQQTGVEFTAFTTALQRQGRRISDAAKGTGEAKDALRELGIEAAALSRLTLDQQFEVLADAFAEVEDEGRKSALAMKLWDSEGVKLLQTAKGGSEAVRALRAEADELGLTLDQDVADTATEAVDAIGRLRAQFKASGEEIIRILGPSIATLANWLSEKLPRAIAQSNRFLIALRIGAVETAAKVAEAVGNDAAAANLRDLANVYRDSFDDVSQSLENFEADIGEAVNAADFMDDSLKRHAETAKAAKTAQQELNKELAEAASITQSVRSPTAVYADELERLQGFYEREQITLETLNRARGQARDALEQALGIEPTALEAYTRELEKLDEAFDNAGLSIEEYERRLRQLDAGLEEPVQKTREKLEETESALTEFSKGAAQSAQSALADFFFDPVGSSLDDLVGNFANALRQIAAQAAANAVFNALPGSSEGLLGIFGALFGGGRQLGGPVAGRVPVLVGERGPELFVPPTGGGQIQPATGGGPITVNLTVAQDVSRDSASQIGYDLARSINESTRRNG